MYFKNSKLKNYENYWIIKNWIFTQIMQYIIKSIAKSFKTLYNKHTKQIQSIIVIQYMYVVFIYFLYCANLKKSIQYTKTNNKNYN